MTPWWPGILFGWPSALCGMALLVLGVLSRRVLVSVAGVVVAAGFCIYVGLNPLPFQVLGPLVLLSNIFSAVAVQSGRRRLAAMLLLPFVAIVLYFGIAVWRSGSGVP